MRILSDVVLHFSTKVFLAFALLDHFHRCRAFTFHASGGNTKVISSQFLCSGCKIYISWKGSSTVWPWHTSASVSDTSYCIHKLFRNFLRVCERRQAVAKNCHFCHRQHLSWCFQSSWGQKRPVFLLGAWSWSRPSLQT